MGKKPVTDKRNIMRLASAAEEAPAEADNISPVLDRSETNLFDELCNATREGDLERVAYIISVGGPVNAVDKWQCSPLYWACRCFCTGLVSMSPVNSLKLCSNRSLRSLRYY